MAVLHSQKTAARRYEPLGHRHCDDDDDRAIHRNRYRRHRHRRRLYDWRRSYDKEAIGVTGGGIQQMSLYLVLVGLIKMVVVIAFCHGQAESTAAAALSSSSSCRFVSPCSWLLMTDQHSRRRQQSVHHSSTSTTFERKRMGDRRSRSRNTDQDINRFHHRCRRRIRVQMHAWLLFSLPSVLEVEVEKKQLEYVVNDDNDDKDDDDTRTQSTSPPTTYMENRPRVQMSTYTPVKPSSSSSSSFSSFNNNNSKKEKKNHHDDDTKKKSNNIWQRRNARTVEEGIRREKAHELSTILSRASSRLAETVQQNHHNHNRTTTDPKNPHHHPSIDNNSSSNHNNHNKNNPPPRRRQYAARTLTGLIHALAEEAEDLAVDVHTRENTPLWEKHVEAVRIQFSRLGFKPLRLGGQGLRTLLHHHDNLENLQDKYHPKIEEEKEEDGDGNEDGASSERRSLTSVSSADEAFDRIDVDKSGTLDTDEIAEALTVAAASAAGVAAHGGASIDLTLKQYFDFLRNLASELVALYDFNGDGVVDRFEYQSMVEDMAALQNEEEEEKLAARKAHEPVQTQNKEPNHILSGFFSTISSFFTGLFTTNSKLKEAPEQSYTPVTVEVPGIKSSDVGSTTSNKSVGSITLSDLKLDLRRLLFGAIPLVKHLTPGGPLILEPFTVTITGSFNRDDIMHSYLLDAGLRRLVAQALRRRVIRPLRDLIDGAVFHGRSWKLSSTTAPVVEVTDLSNIEFDTHNKLIMTGRVKVKARQELPFIENSFKLRTKIGTRQNGRIIRLVEPELALVLECPEVVDTFIVKLCAFLSVDCPRRPDPLFSFFPLYSPFKLDDENDGGFDLGEDNCIQSIDIADAALRFELSAVLRPGRFLGNHYLAFTIPIRTFIITLDRIKQGIRSARATKKQLREQQQQHALAVANHLSSSFSTEPWSKNKKTDPLLQQPQHQHQPQSKARFRAFRQWMDAAWLSLSNHPSRNRSSSSHHPHHHHNNSSRNRHAKQSVQPKSFFSRFVDGYLRAEREATATITTTPMTMTTTSSSTTTDTNDEIPSSERVTLAIRDFFGRQGQQAAAASGNLNESQAECHGG